jgi:S1-C subfamily serine protease
VPAHSIIDVLVATLEQPIGQQFSMTASGGAGPHEYRMAVEPLPHPDGSALAAKRLGLHVTQVSAQQAARLGFDSGVLVVTSVTHGSPAESAEIARGDILVQVGRLPIPDLDTLGQVLSQVKKGQTVTLVLDRVAGRERFRSAVGVEIR